LIVDILSKVFDDENAPAFEAFAQVTIAIGGAIDILY